MGELDGWCSGPFTIAVLTWTSSIAVVAAARVTKEAEMKQSVWHALTSDAAQG